MDNGAFSFLNFLCVQYDFVNLIEHVHIGIFAPKF